MEPLGNSNIGGVGKNQPNRKFKPNVKAEAEATGLPTDKVNVGPLNIVSEAKDIVAGSVEQTEKEIPAVTTAAGNSTPTAINGFKIAGVTTVNAGGEVGFEKPAGVVGVRDLHFQGINGHVPVSMNQMVDATLTPATRYGVMEGLAGPNGDPGQYLRL